MAGLRVSSAGAGALVLALACSPSTQSPAAAARASSAEAGAKGSAVSSSEAVPVGVRDPTWGQAAAPVTLVAFLDFECAFCARVHPTLRALLDKYGPEQIRLVVKHAPLPFHERAIPAAVAAQAVYEAAGGNAFLEYADLLFDEADALSDSRLLASAEAVGVARDVYLKHVADPAVARKVQADSELAAELGIDGVPAFLINGAPLVGARPIADFQTIIEHELRAASELLRRGVSAPEVFASRVSVNFGERAAASAEPPAYEDTAYRVPVGSSPARGPENAPVTIVEFADFECSYCARAHQTMEKLLEKYPGKIRWVMKHTPLAFHPAAVPAAITALEARRQKGEAAYWQAVERIYAAPQLTPDALLQIAETLNLEPQALRAALKDEVSHPQLQADADLALDLEARGTPHFFINGRRMAGAQPLSVFEEVVKQELQKVATLGEAQGSGTTYESLQREAQAPPGLVRQDVPPPPDTAPGLGKDAAPVTVQMFSDLECAYCRRALPTLSALMKKYPDQVRVVWRHLPLGFHKQARRAAVAALEAQAQLGGDGFWKMSALMWGFDADAVRGGTLALDGASLESGSPASDLSMDALKQHARALGLDEPRFVRAVEAGVHLPTVEQDEALAARLGVNATPAFFVNGYSLMGAQPLNRFERLVRRALEDGRAPQERSATKASELGAAPAQ